MAFTKSRWLLIAALVIGITLLLVACGDSATNTPVPTSTPTFTTASATTASVTTAPAGKGVNPIVATITAASGPSQGGGASAPVIAATPTPQTTPISNASPAASAGTLPVYSGFKPVNLGDIGKQISGTLSQATSSAHSDFYYTSAPFSSVTGYYNTELGKQGYKNVTQQQLPASGGLGGSVVVYAKGSGSSAEAIAITALGPLDSNTISTLALSAPDVSSLKSGDSLIIVLSGLNATSLNELQQSLGDNSTVAPSGTVGPAGTPGPTR
ncbi:MAG TPA: hypothetical protein VH186_38835 [Chloroflexia bacterium]|nr:hypothetical protein [Chloroflexia bacterium]